MEYYTVPDAPKIEAPPEMKYYLYPFGSECVVFSLPTRPCWWFRIWLRAFLGWKFEPIEKPEDEHNVQRP